MVSPTVPAWGSPVQFVRTPDAAVPSAGVVNVGDVKVLLVSVSEPARVQKSLSDKAALNCAVVPDSVLLVRLIVLLVSVSVLEEVIMEPLVGRVMLVVPVSVNVREYAPDVAKLPASANVPVVTVRPVAPELIITALLPFPERSGSFAEMPVSTALNSARMVAELPEELVAGAPVES